MHEIRPGQSHVSSYVIQLFPRGFADTKHRRCGVCSRFLFLAACKQFQGNKRVLGLCGVDCDERVIETHSPSRFICIVFHSALIRA